MICRPISALAVVAAATTALAIAPPKSARRLRRRIIAPCSLCVAVDCGIAELHLIGSSRTASTLIAHRNHAAEHGPTMFQLQAIWVPAKRPREAISMSAMLQESHCETVSAQ